MRRYKTQNLYEGAFLLAKGFQLAGKERMQNKTLIIFEGNGVEEEALDFYNGGKIEQKSIATGKEN